MKFIDNIVDRALARGEAVAERQLTALRVEALAMIRDEMPTMAGAIAEKAVLTVFNHTTIDEAANDVAGVITDIFDRLPFRRPPGTP